MLLSACFILRDRLPVQTEQTCDSTHKLFPTPFVSGIAVFIVEAEFFRHTKPAFPMFCRLEAEVEPALYLTELQNDPSSTVDGPLNRVVSPPFSRRSGRVIKTMSPSELARPGWQVNAIPKVVLPPVCARCGGLAAFS